MMFIDCWMVVVYGVMGSKYQECNSSIRTENTLYNRILNDQTKSPDLNKRGKTNKSQTIKLVLNNTGTEWLSVL
jgi:hypothetical protein